MSELLNESNNELEYLEKSIRYWENVEQDALTQLNYARKQLDQIQQKLEEIL